MSNLSAPDRGAARLIGLFVVLVFAITVGGIALISTGMFDPKPLGSLKDRFPLEPEQVDAGKLALTWLDQPRLESSFSLRLTGAYQAGEQDLGYGLAIGQADSAVLIGVSPLGYLTIFRTELPYDADAANESILPWQTWPHIKGGNQPNEIWVDVQDGNIMSIRINRELLTSEVIPVGGDQVGVWAQSFGETAMVEFPLLEHFESDD